MWDPTDGVCGDCGELIDERENTRNGGVHDGCLDHWHATNPTTDPDDTSRPRRIQLQRKNGWRKPPGAVVVARPSRWGNPFTLGGPYGLARVPAIVHPGREWEYETRISAAGTRHDYTHPDGRVTPVRVRAMTAAEAVQCYRAWIGGGGWPINQTPRDAPTVEEIRTQLAGKDLCCWCRLDQPCHADVLLYIANTAPDQLDLSVSTASRGVHQ